MATIGYARVSTTGQTLDRQIDALNAAGVDRVFTDKISGAQWTREGLDALLGYVREGDTVVVQSLDRLGRTLSQVISLADRLHQQGVVLRTITEGIDYSTAMGKMIAGIFGALAQYERHLINERAADARAAAKARGKNTGRPPAMTAEQVEAARNLREAGTPVPMICSTLKVAKSTLYRVLAS
jgi:DNA invertase Pin-like site-specific DNA recombinase